MKVTKDIIYIGVNDHEIDLFEGQYQVPNGMAYNSYVIMDEKIAIMDSVDIHFTNEWLSNIKNVLKDRQPNYLVIQHMEPDHSASIKAFIEQYPDTILVGNATSFKMLDQFFEFESETQRLIVKNGETLDLGQHKLSFIFAPMVHWPEVMFSYDETDKVLFSADAFGKFGANDVEEEWVNEARRYYFCIVGKYGLQVQSVLKKIQNLDIQIICSLHGPVLNKGLEDYLNLYNTWSSYQAESEGVVIAYTSIYGNTKKAVELLNNQLIEQGCEKIVIFDLARDEISKAVEAAFKYSKLILATTTYNADIFPFMKEYIECLIERNFQNRTIGMIENGSWAPIANKLMKQKLENNKNITYLENNVTIQSSLNNQSKEMIKKMAIELCQ